MLGAFNPTGGGTISNGRIAEVLLYDRVLSGDELSQLHVYANARYGMVPLRNRVVMTEGGSWTFGLGVAGAGGVGGETYQRYAFERTNFSITGYNSGVSGQTALQMIADGPTLDRTFDACAPRNVCVFWGGSNDIESGATAATTWSRIQQFCNERRAVGWRVLLLPIVDRVAANQTFFDTERQTLTGLITAGWPAVADGFVDLTVNPNLGGVGARNNSTYYQADQIHLTPVANQLVGELVAPTLNALLS
jgi:lysophospholipase L1-like esterase